jgi:hypothetical protein
MTLLVIRRLLLAAAVVSLSACQSKKPPQAEMPAGKSAALRSMEQVATAAYKCWFAAKDPAFRGYSFANELNSFSGTPRFLLVPKKNFGGKPLLVVQASGGAGRVETFGPLMSEPVAARIRTDVDRWHSGDGSCGAAA